jgi:deferrochelatase/peroxidase EfeB
MTLGTLARIALTLLAVAGPARPADPTREPFYGPHQAGIATSQQKNIYFMSFDLVTDQRQAVIDLLRAWTRISARLTMGEPAGATAVDPGVTPEDGGDTLGLAPSRLTVTVGFGPGLFSKDGVDRYGLARRRPEAFVDLPRFPGDQLVAERCGGDLGIQICSDDPQVSLHAARELARVAEKAAEIRWVQAGFIPIYGGPETPRNLMGFKDGTLNIPTSDPAQMDKLVWVGAEGGWLRDGSYLVVRPIRISLEHWDQMKLGFQEQVVGRHKLSGAPLGGVHEKDPLDLAATDGDGNPVLPETSHARLASPEHNHGAQILRRGYSYDNGVAQVAERWPPWHQGIRFDAGLLFVCFQRDPRSGFIPIFEQVSKFDMMNQFVTTLGSAVFACPAGVPSASGYFGQGLFE